VGLHCVDRRHLDDEAFERLECYEAPLWRQMVQTFALQHQASINSWSVPHIAGDLALDLIAGFPVQFWKFAGRSCVQFFLRRVFGPLLMLPRINRFDRLCLFLPKFRQRAPAILGPLICVTVSRTALASRCASASLTSDALISCLGFLAPPRMGEVFRSVFGIPVFAATVQLPHGPATKLRVRWTTVRPPSPPLGPSKTGSSSHCASGAG
jgi:hypothetical protein